MQGKAVAQLCLVVDTDLLALLRQSHESSGDDLQDWKTDNEPEEHHGDGSHESGDSEGDEYNPSDESEVPRKYFLLEHP
ncbi:hypothetical protein NM688_g5176 [Phlebia brevispora]|uniref:Uncharacterized protein n=1 Tax=Phlebia brevispora TaxID=194682 RepID=A0ACC1SZD6_9APHY|nr:hypothetical protein NM688_g5176 [Phlebia brevispora]